jgi:hypothetical protein
LKLQKPSAFAQKNPAGEALSGLNRMVNYLDLRPSRSVENPFSDWRRLGAQFCFCML